MKVLYVLNDYIIEILKKEKYNFLMNWYIKLDSCIKNHKTLEILSLIELTSDFLYSRVAEKRVTE